VTGDKPQVYSDTNMPWGADNRRDFSFEVARERGVDHVSLERITAFLAQSFATLLAVAGLVALLSYTHMKSYRAGYCAERVCEVEEQAEQSVEFATSLMSPPGQQQTSLPAVIGPNSVSGLTPSQGSSSQSASGQNASASDESEQSQPPSPPSSSSSIDPFDLEPYPVGLESAAEICFSQTGQAHEADIARCWLRAGDAYQAMGLSQLAQSAWNVALNIGSAGGGAQSSLQAHQRLQSAILAQTCPTNGASLRRIANGYNRADVQGEIIDLNYRQNALMALGYYSDDVDGEYGPMTRRAVRDFQSDMGFDQTGALNPQETVDLICHAAVTARDASAQNLLGIMFATGLGVNLNVDMATEWLEIAAMRGHGEANFNLALIYGTGTVQGSYRLCGLVESPERADSYLRQAAELGHTRAQSLRSHMGTGGNPAERWDAIAAYLGRQAEASDDQFYQAWQARLLEAEGRLEQRRLAEENNLPFEEVALPGCYLESFYSQQENDYDTP